MTSTFRRLREHMQKSKTHLHIKGRKTVYTVPDRMKEGAVVFMSNKMRSLFSDESTDLDLESLGDGEGDEMEVGEDGEDLYV